MVHILSTFVELKRVPINCFPGYTSLIDITNYTTKLRKKIIRQDRVKLMKCPAFMTYGAITNNIYNTNLSLPCAW